MERSRVTYRVTVSKEGPIKRGGKGSRSEMFHPIKWVGQQVNYMSSQTYFPD